MKKRDRLALVFQFLPHVRVRKLFTAYVSHTLLDKNLAKLVENKIRSYTKLFSAYFNATIHNSILKLKILGQMLNYMWCWDNRHKLGLSQPNPYIWHPTYRQNERGHFCLNRNSNVQMLSNNGGFM